MPGMLTHPALCGSSLCSTGTERRDPVPLHNNSVPHTTSRLYRACCLAPRATPPHPLPPPPPPFSFIASFATKFSTLSHPRNLLALSAALSRAPKTKRTSSLGWLVHLRCAPNRFLQTTLSVSQANPLLCYPSGSPPPPPVFVRAIM